jgi:hypothetical protein
MWLFLLVFVSAASLDYCHSRYIMAVQQRWAWRAAGWSMLGWCSGIVGFFVAVKVTMWVLPAEALGLGAGTLLSVKRAKLKIP